jgi:hypothetical protein
MLSWQDLFVSVYLLTRSWDFLDFHLCVLVTHSTILETYFICQIYNRKRSQDLLNISVACHFEHKSDVLFVCSTQKTVLQLWHSNRRTWQLHRALSFFEKLKAIWLVKSKYLLLSTGYTQRTTVSKWDNPLMVLTLRLAGLKCESEDNNLMLN